MGTHRGTRLFMLIIIMVCSPAAVTAQTVGVALHTVRGEAVSYRYQINDRSPEAWTETEEQSFTITYESDAVTEDVLHLEYTPDGTIWLPCSYYTFDPSSDRWVAWSYERSQQDPAVPSRFQISCGAQALTPFGCLSDRCGQTYGGRIRLAGNPAASQPGGFFTELGYGLGSTVDERIEEFHDLNAGIGGFYTFSTGSLTLIPLISGGVLFHLLDYAEGISGETFYVDMFGSMGLQAAIEVAAGLDIYAESRVLAFPEQDRVGVFAGLETGIMVDL
ncbi:MAG: hypothetical protein K9M84_11640 [Spirochaetia bacterium]|nr:hypothetical protein [Spirochaetia bacterium]